MAKKSSAAAAAAEGTIVSEEPVAYERRRAIVHVDDLQRSQLNYRKRVDEAKLAELAASIARLGVLEPPLVRELPRERHSLVPDAEGVARFEIIAGERRWRASEIAAQTVPARAELEVIVLDVDDATAAEIMVVENDQREDPHPLDQADGFVQLRDRFGRTPEQIAAKLHRPVRYVYERLRLATLCDEARAAMHDGKFGVGVGLELARIANAKLQAKAVKEVLDANRYSPEVSVEAARRHVRDRYMLRLAQAPFPVADAELVAAAGACATCPKNTASQPTLLAEELGKDDLCTDPACWDKKRNAAWERQAESAKEEGKKVLSAKEAKSILPQGGWGPLRAGYVDLDQPEPGVTGHKTWRALLGKKRLRDVTITLTRNAEGKALEIAKRDDVLAAIRKSPSSTDPKALHESEKKPAASAHDRDKWRREAAIADETDARIFGAIVKAVEDGGSLSNLPFWRSLALGTAEVAGLAEAAASVIERRKLASEDDLTRGDTVEVIARAAADMTAPQLLALIVELTFRDLPGNREKLTASLCDALNVDVKFHKSEATRAVKAREKEAEKAAKAAAKTPKKPKSRAELDAAEAQAKREQLEDTLAGEYDDSDFGGDDD